MLLNELLKDASALEQEIISIRREIHRNPEISFNVDKTQKLILDFLSKYCFDSIEPIGKHFKKGVRAVINKGKGGRKIILRADMDALPIQETKQSEYCSQVNGAMHACGHDAHVAMLLGAAAIISKHKNSFNGEINFIFEPAEEISARVAERLITGAEDLAEDGILEGVNECFAIHVNSELPCGTVGVNYGNTMAAVAAFEIDFTGVGGHGGMPHQCVDPLPMAADFINNIYVMMAREINPTEQAVITIGTINGGDALNVVPGKVTMTGTFRTYKKEINEKIWQAFYRYADGIAKSHRGEYEIRERFHDGWAVVNSKESADTVIKAAGEVLGVENAVVLSEPNMSGETFGIYLEHIPGAFYWLGTGNKDKGIDKKIHHPEFDIDEEALINGVKMHIAVAFECLGK